MTNCVESPSHMPTLSGVLCSFVCISCVLVTVSAMMPDFVDTDNIRTHPLVLCGGFLEAQEHLRVNNTLDESRCVSIDVCTEVNIRQQPVPRETWINYRDPVLSFHGLDMRHEIEYVRVPDGIVLYTCTADFHNLMVGGISTCDVNTLDTIVGDCPMETGDPTQSLDIIEEDSTCQYPLREQTMMFKYGFLDGWGCHKNHTQQHPMPNKDSTKTTGWANFTVNCRYKSTIF